MLQKMFLISAIALTCHVAHAAELEITLGNESVRGAYLQPVGTKRADNVATFDAGLLYNEENDEDRLLGHVGLLIFGDTGAAKANIQAGVGVRGVAFDADGGTEGAALSLGGAVNGRVPQFNRLGGRVWAWYAPSVAAFSDLDGYLEWGISIDYQLIRQAYITAGYRDIEVGLDNGPDAEVEEGAFFGLRMVF